MSEEKRKRGRERVYDAERTREVILNASEALFAEHGFDGTTVDTIAKKAGYNKSLLFQYFGDKLGLYTQVLKRADREMGELMARLAAPLLADETVALKASQFKEFLTTMVRSIFDYMSEHPRFVRMLTWEMADGWQTFAHIASQFPPEDTVRFDALFRKAHNAGLLRSDFMPVMQLTMMLPLCQTYLAYLPLYQRLLPHEEIAAAHRLADARAYLVDFVVAGMVNDMPETKDEKES
jgi:AcrR family transcriptional regulator